MQIASKTFGFLVHSADPLLRKAKSNCCSRRFFDEVETRYSLQPHLLLMAAATRVGSSLNLFISALRSHAIRRSLYKP